MEDWEVVDVLFGDEDYLECSIMKGTYDGGSLC